MSADREETPSLQVLRAADHRRMPWRNGAGVTCEIAALPDGSGSGEFDWRISIAEVTDGGPFSSFPGIERTIVLIEGEWMALTVDGRRYRFGLHEPFTFDGGSETQCEVAGLSRDLNVMTRRGRVTATVVIATAASGTPGTAERSDVAVVCLVPGVRLTDTDGTTVDLDALDAVLSTGHPSPTIDGDGTAAVITLKSVTPR